MPKRVVRQPNDRYAIFSTVVDDFVMMDMTVGEVVDELVLELGELDALRKARNGVLDADPYTLLTGNGLDRWRDCLETIEIRHGKAVVKGRLELIGVKEG